jgi:hypothetical protein
MPFKSDPAKVDVKLAKIYADAGRDLIETGGASQAWSTSETIAGALAIGRGDLLPGVYQDPISAIDRLRDSDEWSWDTVLHLREVGLGQYP